MNERLKVDAIILCTSSSKAFSLLHLKNLSSYNNVQCFKTYIIYYNDLINDNPHMHVLITFQNNHFVLQEIIHKYIDSQSLNFKKCSHINIYHFFQYNCFKRRFTINWIFYIIILKNYKFRLKTELKSYIYSCSKFLRKIRGKKNLAH